MSIGCADDDPRPADPVELIRRADAALYRAKESGGIGSCRRKGEIAARPSRLRQVGRLGRQAAVGVVAGVEDGFALEAEEVDLRREPHAGLCSRA